MKVTMIRITRTVTRKITEHVDVDVNQDDDDTYKAPEIIARELIEATLAAGHDVDWVEDNDVDVKYPAPILNAARIEDGPLAIESAPIQPPAPTGE